MAITHPPTFLGWGLRLLVLEPPVSGCPYFFVLELVATCRSCLHQGKKAAWSGLQKILRFGGHQLYD